ncbi:MAG: FAD-binding oxidoreductase [Rhodocyclaceae bacterium]|nr:FAD-binding oxidoreductase [Rhodocyclaceae bacterium]
MSDLIDTLRAIVGTGHVLTGGDNIAPFATDWRGRYQGTPLAIVSPGDTPDVAEVVRLCAQEGVAIVPQGGNTGLCGGATPIAGEIVVSLRRLRRVRAVDVANNTITVEAGCTLFEVQEAARHADRLFPLSLAAEGTATIGGNLSTNAGGVQVLRYGNARDLCLGLEVVLADGRVWHGLRGLRKDNTGYDLKHLFIGAEGTLGLITAAVLKLYSRPRSVATAWASVPTPEAAVTLLTRLREKIGGRVTAFELVGRPALDLVLGNIPGSRDPLPLPSPWQVLIELSDTMAGDISAALEEVLAEAIVARVAADAAIARNEKQARAFWALRENISEAQKIEGVSIKHDISLPVSRIPEFIARGDATLASAFPGVRIVCFGHLGDGNLHYNQSKPRAQDNAAFIGQTEVVNRIVHDLVAELGGSISAEHGLGQLKRDEVLRYKSEVEMDLMRKVKQALDPRGLMNPGKVL